MSKVNSYLDSKQKARHRQRRYETAHKKFSRARKYERGEYRRFYGQCGYCVERQRERIVHIPVKDAGGRTIYIPIIKRDVMEICSFQILQKLCGINRIALKTTIPEV